MTKSTGTMVVMAVLATAVAFSACRREVRHEPLKLGASDVPVQQTIAIE